MDHVVGTDPPESSMFVAFSSNDIENYVYQRHLDHSTVVIYTKNIRKTELFFDHISDKTLFDKIDDYIKYKKSISNETLLIILHDIEDESDLQFWCEEYLDGNNNSIVSLYYFKSYANWRRRSLLNYQKIHYVYKVTYDDLWLETNENEFRIMTDFCVNDSIESKIKSDNDNNVVIFYGLSVRTMAHQRLLKGIQSFINNDDNTIYSCLENWKFFNEFRKYHKYLRTTRAKNIILIIWTSQYSAHNVLLQIIEYPHLYLRSQLTHIYLFGRYTENLPISKSNRLIHYFVDKSSLYSKLRKSITEPLLGMHVKDENDFQISLRTTNRIQFQLLIDVLSRMEQTHESKTEMLEEFRSHYGGQLSQNAVQLKNIDRFEREYISDQAIHWYTRDCFLFRVVNYLCRTQNIDLLYSIRYYIGDLCRQLTQLHLASPIVTPIMVYRGQLMSMEELLEYKFRIGNYYCANTFMSTTRSRDIALTFAGDENSDKERVLFCMKIDTHDNKVPFVLIKDFSIFVTEDEILLSIGFTFRICSVHKPSTGGIWIIEMEAVANKSGIPAEIRNKINQYHTDIESTPPLLMLGLLLMEMEEYEKAERYCRMFIETEPNNAIQLATAYQGVADACAKQCQYATALENYELALKVCFQNFDHNSSHPLITKLYKNIAKTYTSLCDYNSALAFYQKC
ncbi:unnamed protein product, partial [Rotaria sp. Silwood2]